MSKTGALRRQLGPLKHHLTTRISAVTTVLDLDAEQETVDSREHLDDLIEAKSNLLNAATRLQTKHDEWVTLLQDFSDPTELETEQGHYDKVCDEYLDLLLQAEMNSVKLDRQIRRLTGQQVTTVSHGPAELRHDSDQHLNDDSDPEERNGEHESADSRDNNGANDQAEARADHVPNPPYRHYMTVKAPKMTLPRFGGDYMAWKQFWGIFKANIHDKPEFTNIERFTYLLGQLDGIAKDTISGLLITEDNYSAAVSLLDDRFNRADERIISMLYSQFKQVPNSGNATKDRQKTLDDCEKFFRQLETAGEDLDSNRSLTIDLLSKFPAAMVRDLQRYYQVSINSKLSEVRQGLKKSILEWETTAGIIDDLQTMKTGSGKGDKSGRDHSGSKSGGDQKGQKDNGSKKFDPARYFINSSLATMGGSNGQTPSRSQWPTNLRPCYFCGENHQNSKCEKYPSASSRIIQLQSNRRCFRCMKKGHGYRNCPTHINCIHCNTENEHTSVLCPVKFPEVKAEDSTFTTTTDDINRAEDTGKPEGQTTSTSGGRDLGFTILNNENKPTLFQTAKVLAENPKTKSQMRLRIALDTMSSRSYITDAAAKKLELFGPCDDKLYVSVFGSQKTYEFPTRQVQFDVYFRDGERHTMAANTTRVICNSGAIPENWSKTEAKVLKEFKYSLADDPFDPHGQIDVLVGADLVWDFIDGGRLPTSAPNLFLIPSKFGLMLSGKTDLPSNRISGATFLCITESPCAFPSETGLVTVSEPKIGHGGPDINEFWNLERIGVSDDPIENDDDLALENFQRTVEFKEDRYEVTFPWIEEKRALLPDNYDLAYDRFKGLAKRLRANPDALKAYQDIIQLQKERQIIEVVPQEQILKSENTVHYLPHHFVVKPSSSTTKVRIVYDAAAKQSRNSPSLNQCLMRGPVILPDLCVLLMKIRAKPICVISDIEKAFLQVGLQEKERDVTRFLWFQDDTNPTLKDNLQILRFRRVAFGIICSPFLLAATIDHHLVQENTPFADSLRNDIYVDNVISTLESDENIREHYNDLKNVFLRAGMNIQEFCSNSPKLMNMLPPEDKIRQPDAKVLGLKWDSQGDDTLRLVSSPKLDSSMPTVTKRIILQVIGSIFDPLGLFQPTILNAKFLLRRLWTESLQWDDAVPEVLHDEWKTVRQDLLNVFSFRIPRFIGPLYDGQSTLAVFCDASSKAYAVSVYLRSRVSDREWRSNLLFSKSRLAPCVRGKDAKRRDITLPRLELLGVFIGSKAGEFCRKAFPNIYIDFFTDSECVMYWIQSRSMLKRFVDRRVTKIRKVRNCQFHYVPTDENPADMSTRGMTSENLFQSKLWWHGPSWLTDEKATWPTRNVPSVTDVKIQEIQNEVKPSYLSQTLAAIQEVPEPERLLGIECQSFSSLSKLVRITAYCLKFLSLTIWRKLSDQIRSRHDDLNHIFGKFTAGDQISLDEFETARHLWIQSVQRAGFPDILLVLQDKLNKRIPMITQLGLQLNSIGLIVCKGRYQAADLPEAARSPILLPRDHCFSNLVIANAHRKVMHSGVSHTLSEVRSEFWIPHGRAIVKKVIYQCLLCRRYKTGKPFKLPPMPPLPHERTSQAIPFQYSGLDYFGPITIRVNQEKVKMWVCLFTCMVVRAVHLEFVTDCSSGEFLHALIRFVSRRGVPELIISDNAAQFRLVKILGDAAWPRVPQDAQINSYLSSNKIRWKFITELAPWQGGFYERLVGVVKSTLRTSIGRRLLTWTDLITLLCEAEAVVNNRPITYINDDPSSRLRVLRPIDFLSPRIESTLNLLSGGEVSNATFGEAGKRLLSIWKSRCVAIERLWKYWYEEYLLSLRERQVSLHRSRKGEISEIPTVNQVVLIHDPDVPRGQWRLARCTAVFRSSDGHVRSAEVVQSNGYKIKRPINHLIPLELPFAGLNQDSASQPQPEGDEEAFSGFSEDDVQRAAEALRRFDDKA
ncbi:MAG: DUF1759 domain-containing protein [Bacteroidota bacterium]